MVLLPFWEGKMATKKQAGSPADQNPGADKNKQDPSESTNSTVIQMQTPVTAVLKIKPAPVEIKYNLRDIKFLISLLTVGNVNFRDRSTEIAALRETTEEDNEDNRPDAEIQATQSSFGVVTHVLKSANDAKHVVTNFVTEACKEGWEKMTSKRWKPFNDFTFYGMEEIATAMIDKRHKGINGDFYADMLLIAMERHKHKYEGHDPDPEFARRANNVSMLGGIKTDERILSLQDHFLRIDSNKLLCDKREIKQVKSGDLFVRRQLDGFDLFCKNVIALVKGDGTPVVSLSTSDTRQQTALPT
jgi:hypothetical protein